ncbi:MAG: hypothetical protein LBT80_04040 [Lactobacillaceae bacterium]|jgi:hypothetical protein|nr:hypothetical protein [Lactobacillaceae bacterium]
MHCNTFNIGDLARCQKHENIDQPFIGKVVAIDNDHCLVEVMFIAELKQSDIAKLSSVIAVKKDLLAPFYTID